MSAFWDDFASDMENEEFAAEFMAACERIANREMGLVPCSEPHGTERTHLTDGEPEVFMEPHGRCPACGAQL